MEITERRRAFAAFFLRQLERFDRPELRARLRTARSEVSRQAQKSPVNTVPKDRLLSCYEELQSLYDNFSADDFLYRPSAVELIDQVAELLPELSYEVDELLEADPAQALVVTPKRVRQSSDEHQNAPRFIRPENTRGMIRAAAPRDQKEVSSADSLDGDATTTEFKIPVSTPVMPKKSWWGRQGLHALTIAAGLFAGEPYSRTKEGIQQSPPSRIVPELRLPEAVDREETEKTPAYEIFREMGAVMEENSLMLKTRRPDRALYWAFLEAGKDKNITHRAWKDAGEVDDQARWAAKWAARLLENGQLNKKFIKNKTVDAEKISKIAEFKNDTLIIRDMAAFYENLVKPLLDFKRD
jgi:hypothetical protein